MPSEFRKTLIAREREREKRVYNFTTGDGRFLRRGDDRHRARAFYRCTARCLAIVILAEIANWRLVFVVVLDVWVRKRCNLGGVGEG